MRILLLLIFCFLQQICYGYKIVKYSNKVTGYSYHILDDSTFKVYKNYVQNLISSKLSPRHTLLISEIILTDSYVSDSTDNAGICCFDGDSARILISIKDNNLDLTVFHEVCHAMKFTYDGSAWKEIEKQWKSCNKFVTDYAKTDIDEDFAEIGSYYFTGHYNAKNKKYDLFRYFIDRI